MSKFFAEEHTRVLSEVIREVETDPATYLGAKYMPAIEVPSNSIFVDVWEARGGLTKEHIIGSDPQSIPKGAFRTQEYSPGAYKETVRFNEQELLFLRQLGANDQSQRGIRQHLNRAVQTLNSRIESRMELLRWQAILNGTYTWQGKVVDFGKPAGNDVAPSVPWGVLSGGVYVANASATPIQDLRFWIMGGYDKFRKYNITGIVMGKDTVRLVLDNPTVQALIQSRFAAETYKMHDINEVLSFLIPGCPKVTVYGGWYQNETINATTGLISVGDAVFFMPAGRLYFETSLPDSDIVGDVVMTMNLATGSMDAPGAGKYVIVDEHIEDRRGNPYVEVIGGFNGGPRLKRAFDTLTATVV